MHPILASRTNFLLYLAAWLPLGAMLGFVLSMSAPINWEESAAITVPLTLVLALVCLSPWYSCRYLPLGSTPVWKLLTNHLLAAVVLSGAVLVVARMAARMAAAGFANDFPHLDQRFRPALPVLGGMVDTLLPAGHCASLRAVCGALLSRGRDTGARIRAESLEGPDQPALSVQQPAFDQRA